MRRQRRGKGQAAAAASPDPNHAASVRHRQGGHRVAEGVPQTHGNRPGGRLPARLANANNRPFPRDRNKCESAKVAPPVKQHFPMRVLSLFWGHLCVCSSNGVDAHFLRRGLAHAARQMALFLHALDVTHAWIVQDVSHSKKKKKRGRSRGSEWKKG